MPIVQVPLDVPDDIYLNVLDGSLELLGMVKDRSQKVRKHIPKAKLPKEDTVAKVKQTKILDVFKDKGGPIAIGVGIALVAIGTGAYVYNKKKEQKKSEAEKAVDEFKHALKEYLKKSKNGQLNVNVVDNLLDSLKKLEKFGNDVQLNLSASQLAEFIFSIFKYTEALAKANSYDIEIAKPKKGKQGNITSLKSYLEVQKQILENAA